MKIKVKVIPGSSRNDLGVLKNGEFCARVTSPPEKGKANRQVVELLSRHLGVAKSRIFITRGGKSSHKIVEILD
jgi:uncharacterized protein